MLLEKIKSEELEFLEDISNPICLAEILFHDFDNKGIFDNEKMGNIRLYQESMLSYEYLIDEDPNLSEKENFKLREGAGNIYAFGARRYGKTLIVEEIDLLLSMIHLPGENVGFASYDALHIRGVLEKVVQVLELHPFFSKVLEPKINRSPNYHFYLKSGYTLDSVNLNLGSKSPGNQFFQKHFKRLYGEEYSFETEEVYKIRLDAISENGCVTRLAGMTNFTKNSPSGRTFSESDKKPWISNYPQYCNPKWDLAEKTKAVREHGGMGTASYRIFVEGEVVTEGISVFDMERVKQCYDEDRTIKHFEINKKNFEIFENILVLDRPSNANMIYCCADIGESAPTEIILLAEVNGIYKYLYNITLYNLTDKQQYKVFKYIVDCISVNIIAMDTTEGTGRAIYRGLNEIYPNDNMVWVSFNEKIDIDFEKDENNRQIFKDGLPVYKQEFIADWSIIRLKILIYDKLMYIPQDFKFDIQISNVVSMLSGKRNIYSCVAEEDHLISAFRVFSIAEWQCKFKNIKSLKRKKFSKIGV
jgi:hypothetical protein